MPAKAASRKTRTTQRKAKPAQTAKIAATTTTDSQAQPQLQAAPQLGLGAASGYFEEFIKEIAGKDGMKIIESMEGDGCTDETIEQKTELKIAEVRCILNHLHSYGVVEYKREKNMQNGWFTYTWNVNRERALQNYLQIKKRECDSMRQKIAYADGATVYKCRKGCGNYAFDEAMEAQFRCEKCKGMLYHEDKTNSLKGMEERVHAMEQLLQGFQTAMTKPAAAETVAEEMVAKATAKAQKK